MPRATLIVRKAAVRPEQIVDTVTLGHADRANPPTQVRTGAGLSIDLALARAGVLEDGDALKLDDGRLVTVRAADEALLQVQAANPVRLMRLAWQLGSHHVPAEIAADALYAPESAAELVRGSGCSATPVTRPFRPERDLHDHSQCGHDHHHTHHHHHERDHSHDHDGDRDRTHVHHDAHHAHRHDH